MDDPKLDKGKLFFLADAWMVPLALFAMIYFCAKGNLVFGGLMGIVLIGAIVKIYQWSKDRKKK